MFRPYWSIIRENIIWCCTKQFFFFLLALQLPMGVVFYSPLVGFSLLAYDGHWDRLYKTVTKQYFDLWHIWKNWWDSYMWTEHV